MRLRVLRVLVPLLLLVGMVAAPSPAAAAARPAGGTITWDVNHGLCYSNAMQAHTIMTTSGTAGVNWMKIVLTLQTYYNGRWHIRQTYSVWDRHYFRRGSYQYIQSTHRFFYHGVDFQQPTIIRADFYWYDNSVWLYHHSDATGQCR